MLSKATFTFIDVIVAKQRLSLAGAEGDVSETHGGCQGERDGEPDEAARQEAQYALPRLGRHGTLPVRLVHVRRPEPASNNNRRFVFHIEASVQKVVYGQKYFDNAYVNFAI